MEQRKIALISWITNLKDESIISKIESFRNASLKELPDEITELLSTSDSISEEDCIEHTSSKSLLGKS